MKSEISAKGLKPKDRRMAIKQEKKIVTANQWQNTPQQNKFMKAWLDPTSPTFSNAYKSALEAGYNDHYAMKIASPDTANQWIGEYRKLSKLEMEHLEQKLSKVITGEITRKESNSPVDSQIKAIELYAKLTGKLDTKNTTNVTLVQPILNGTSMTRTRVEPTD